MKNLILFIYSLGLYLSLPAQALVLGELKGTGTARWIYETTQGPQSRDLKCNFAMNIKHAPTQFVLEYAYYECGSLGAWNDFEITGTISDGSAAQFQTVNQQKHHYTENSYDSNCQIIARKKTLTLTTTKIASFKKNIDNSYQFTQDIQSEQIAYSSKRDYPHCPSTMKLIKTKSTVHIEGLIH